MVVAFIRLLLICLFYIFLISSMVVDSGDTLGLHQNLDRWCSLVSANGRFELGLFNASSRRDIRKDWLYLGIWYKDIYPLTVVWVANREKPLRGNAARVFVTPRGDLMARDNKGTQVFLSRSNQSVSRPSLVILNSGNLVIRDEDNESEYVWQSFDYPTDTLLPGMKLGWDLSTGFDRVMTSWRTSDDPYLGDFVFGLKYSDLPQLVVQKNGVIQSRWGPWTGNGFSGAYFMENPVFKVVYHFSHHEVYFSFEMLDDSVLLRLVVNPIGGLEFLKWRRSSRAWVTMLTLNKDVCDRYNSCGPYGVCQTDEPGCLCLNGFVANSARNWGRMDCTDGCRRNYALNCSDHDGFIKYTGLKLPDNFTVWHGLSSKECEDGCLKDCNCMAYTSIDVFGSGNECVVWLDNLIDMRHCGKGGDEIYIRVARAEIDSLSCVKKRNILIVCCVVTAILLGISVWRATRRCRSACYRACKRGFERYTSRSESDAVREGDENVKLFNMPTISAATNRFSQENKIGQGGFGTVYKGQLRNGQRIAVKRLSQSSTQGVREFKNEVCTIAQLQHRNLVKLLGCAIRGNERMLIYEFMPNKSLDQYLFNPARKHLLQWEKRFSIIKGIAKGLDYLHSGSRLRIIHRDLKASNVLLDEEMNPKISDFGLARNCENLEEETTRRVIGTYGYMSPEYVIEGHYSTKSDVFSFGALALEIISGQRNWGFHHPDHEFNLLGHAWKLWKEGRELEMVDPMMQGPVVEPEVSRCIHIGLLCAQHSSEERPTMSQVVSVLENGNIELPEPLEPGFFTQRSSAGNIAAHPGWSQESINWLTVTTLSARE